MNPNFVVAFFMGMIFTVIVILIIALLFFNFLDF